MMLLAKKIGTLALAGKINAFAKATRLDIPLILFLDGSKDAETDYNQRGHLGVHYQPLNTTFLER